jgi:hypothetical protein
MDSIQKILDNKRLFMKLKLHMGQWSSGYKD